MIDSALPLVLRLPEFFLPIASLTKMNEYAISLESLLKRLLGLGNLSATPMTRSGVLSDRSPCGHTHGNSTPGP